MVRIALQFKASLENLTNVRPDDDDFRWYLKLRCQNCGEGTKDWVYMCLSESQAIKGSRGSANFVSKCKLCGRENSMDIIKDSITEYKAEDSNRYKTMVAFDCRGLEPVDFSPRGGFMAEGVDSGSKFLEVNLTEKDWSDYDEKVSEAVGIYELVKRYPCEVKRTVEVFFSFVPHGHPAKEPVDMKDRIWIHCNTSASVTVK